MKNEMTKEEIKKEAIRIADYISKNYDTLNESDLLESVNNLIVSIYKIEYSSIDKFKNELYYLSSRDNLISLIRFDLSQIHDEHLNHRKDGYFQLRATLMGVETMFN